MWPDWAIYWTLGNFSKPLATINLPKSPTFIGNFCKGVKIFNFSIEIIFGQLLQKFGNILLVTLMKRLKYDLKMGHSRPLFLYFRLFNTVDSKPLFNIKVANDWIWTVDLRYWKQLLCQLSHNNCPRFNYICNSIIKSRKYLLFWLDASQYLWLTSVANLIKPLRS